MDQSVFFGSLAMMALVIGIVSLFVVHQHRVMRYQKTMQKMEEEQQSILLNATIKLQEEERQRLAADLHDDAGPLLATARLYLNDNLINLDKPTQQKHVSAAKNIIDDAIQLIRNISHSLMPPSLKNFGLESAVHDLFQKIDGSGSIKADCQFHNYKERIDVEQEQIVFRIVQELVNNILKHSHATFINISQNTIERFYIQLRHDGKGLTQPEFEKLTKSSGGLGLKNIQSRIRVMRGNIFFKKELSHPEYTITIELPIAEEMINYKRKELV